MGIRYQGSATSAYKRGAHRKTKPERMRILLLPMLSDRTPTGKEKSIPVSGDIAEMIPITSGDPPIAPTKRGRTGFFDMVVLNIPKKPISER